MKKILVASFALISLVLSSCEKESPMIDVSFEKALMDKKWRVVKVTQNPNVNEPLNTWYEITNSIEPCKMDDRLQFKSPSEVTFINHFKKCTESDPDTKDYGYTIENEKYIKIFENWNDVNNSTWRGGEFAWQMHNDSTIVQFTIDERKSAPSTPDIVVSTIYTYQKTAE